MLVQKKRITTRTGKKVSNGNGGWTYLYPSFGILNQAKKDFLKIKSYRRGDAK